MRLIGLAVILTLNLALALTAAEAQDAYRIGPEDVLQISVWKNDAMTRLVPVRPDGKISLPLLNDVQAAGLTALELRAVLAQRLAEYMPNPEVSVVVTDIRSITVCVGGEAARPGCHEVRSKPVTLDAPVPAPTAPLMWDGLLMRNGKPFPR